MKKSMKIFILILAGFCMWASFSNDVEATPSTDDVEVAPSTTPQRSMGDLAFNISVISGIVGGSLIYFGSDSNFSPMVFTGMVVGGTSLSYACYSAIRELKNKKNSGSIK